MAEDKHAQKPRKNGKISLHPLTFEQALEGLLKAKPPKKEKPGSERPARRVSAAED